MTSPDLGTHLPLVPVRLSDQYYQLLDCPGWIALRRRQRQQRALARATRIARRRLRVATRPPKR